MKKRKIYSRNYEYTDEFVKEVLINYYFLSHAYRQFNRYLT